MSKNILKTSLVFLLVFVLTPTQVVNAFTPLTLVSYEVSETTISPDSDGVQDTVSIDIKYSEEVTGAEINILDSTGTKVINLYHPPAPVTNPQSKIWDGKNTGGQIVPSGIYTIEILGTAVADESNTIYDTSKTISVEADTPVTLSSIVITTPATKLNYMVGDSLDILGLVVTGTYSDTSTTVESITEANVSGFDSATAVNGQILTITVGDKTTTYAININPITVHLNIETSVDVPENCSATDNDGAIHNYPKGDSYLAICALETGIKNGSISKVELSNQFPSLGLFITSINDVTAESNSQYWAVYKNGNFADSGIASLPVVAGDIIMLKLLDFSNNNLGDQVTLNIHSLVVENQGGGGNRDGDTSKNFDVTKAITYLKSPQVQGGDGSFANSLLYTDWAGIAFGALNVSGASKDSLITYFNSHNSVSSLITDNERHAMALLALGKNPYSFNGVNFISTIVASFDGAQFGDAELVNDDIFALIPLKNAGYSATDDMIAKDIQFLISKQNSNGSWEGGPDVTAAAVQALKPFQSVTGVAESLESAGSYLASTQNTDGGWGYSGTSSIFSTSWVMQAMGALGASWTNNSKTAMDYLGTQQVADGAVLPTTDTLANRIWATSYAIAGSTLKPWSTIMKSFPKPIIQNNNEENNSDSSSLNTSENAVVETGPVLCPLGDLFNAITGKACTTFISQNPTEPEAKKITINESSATVSVNKKTNPTLNNETTEKIAPEALSAAVVNSLPEETTTGKGMPMVPIALGISSGVVLLYLGKKIYYHS